MLWQYIQFLFSCLRTCCCCSFKALMPILSRIFTQKMWESLNVSRNAPWHRPDSPSKFHQNRSSHLGAVGQQWDHFSTIQHTFSYTKCGNVGLQRKFYYNYRAPQIFLVLYPRAKCQLPGVAVALKRSRLCSEFFHWRMREKFAIALDAPWPKRGSPTKFRPNRSTRLGGVRSQRKCFLFFHFSAKMRFDFNFFSCKLGHCESALVPFCGFQVCLVRFRPTDFIFSIMRET